MDSLLAHSSLVLLFVFSEEHVGILLGWTVRVGIVEQILDTQQDLIRRLLECFVL